MPQSFEQQFINESKGVSSGESQETMDEMRKRRAKEISNQNKNKFEVWLKQRQESDSSLSQTLNIPPEVRNVLIPPQVYEIAHNIDNVEVVISEYEFDSESESLKIMVIEKDYPFALTDPTEWIQWREEKRKIREQPGLIKIFPNATDGINRLHAEYESTINKGLFETSDRVLFEVTLRFDKKSTNPLYVSHFDGETGKGIGTQFYTETLPFFAKALGFKFVTGMNDNKNIEFFTKKLGRKTLQQIKPEKFSELFPQAGASGRGHLTVQFLDKVDEADYLKDEV